MDRLFPVIVLKEIGHTDTELLTVIIAGGECFGVVYCMIAKHKRFFVVIQESLNVAVVSELRANGGETVDS